MQISSCTDVSDCGFLAIDLKDTDGNRCLSTFQGVSTGLGHHLWTSAIEAIVVRVQRSNCRTRKGARFDCGDRLMIILNPQPGRRNP